MAENTLPASSKSLDTPIEVMRREMRNVAIAERKYHRELALNTKRCPLGEISDKKCIFNSKDVALKARELKKRALPMEDYLALQNALIQDESNIESFLHVDNVLVALRRDLSSKNTAIQLVAASCCCNIALANSRACVSLAKVTGPYLIAHLDSLSSHLVEICAWTVGNLSAGSEIAFKALYAQGCFKRLCTLLNAGEPTILHSVIYALKRCLYAGSKIINGSDITDLARALVSHGRCHDDTEILWLFALISSRVESTAIICPALPIIFNRLRDTLETETASVEQITPVIRLFGNTLCEPDGSAANVILNYSDDELVKFFEILLCHSDFPVRKETLWLIGNLYCHEQLRIRERMRNFIILLPSLKSAISCDRTTV